MDGAYSASGAAGIGVILRNNQGDTLDSFAVKADASSSFMVEAMELKKGLQVAKALDLVNVAFESDNLTLVNCVNGLVCCPNWRCAPVLDDCLSLFRSFPKGSLCWIPWDANRAAGFEDGSCRVGV